MKNIKLLIEYDGTSYKGWQSQKNAISIQDTINNAVSKITKESIHIIGSSRTDSGVHARGQVANFLTNSSIPSEKFADAINRVLPIDIVIKKSSEMNIDFHSRYDAKGKKYRYIIYNSFYPTALHRDRAYHVKNPLDVDMMMKATKFLIGEHDFACFMAAGSSIKDTVRNIYEFSIKTEGDFIICDIYGDGFLYKMVRNIIGTFVEIGTRKTNPEEVAKIIQSKDRKNAGATAPSQGLYLMEVFY